MGNCTSTTPQRLYDYSLKCWQISISAEYQTVLVLQCRSTETLDNLHHNDIS